MSRKTRLGIAVTTVLGAGAVATAALAGEKEEAAVATPMPAPKAEKADAKKAKKPRKVEKAKGGQRRPTYSEMEFSMPAGTLYDVVVRKDIR